MTKLTNIILVVLTILSFTSCVEQAKKTTETKQTAQVSAETIEVYYFHFTRRCATCNAVEEVAKQVLQDSYSEKLQSGKIVFKSVNLDEENSKADAERCNVAGQSLLVLNGETRTDLTSVGFMNARNNPEKLITAIKETIDPLL